MERTFKIKSKTNSDPRFQYPSERRYSASIVLGLSVVFLQFFLYSVLMGTLIIHKMTSHQHNSDFSAFNVSEEMNWENVTQRINTTIDDTVQRLHQRVGKDLENRKHTHYYINIPALVCAGCFIMSLGSIFSFSTGLLAWKRWYIDHNITFFFLASAFSALTSAICLLLSLLATLNIDVDYDEYENTYQSPITLSLVMNIMILSSVGLIWSILSTNVSYRGMKNYYPDDMVVSKGGGALAEVNNVRKDSKHCSTLPPDIINHFSVSGKLAEYLPKKENSDLPKPESNYEYQQRVKQFLSGDSDVIENIK